MHASIRYSIVFCVLCLKWCWLWVYERMERGFLNSASVNQSSNTSSDGKAGPNKVVNDDNGQTCE